MSASTRKKNVKPSRKRRPRERAAARARAGGGLAALALRIASGVAGLLLGAAVPWAWFLQQEAVAQFESLHWDLPGRVYARPLELYRGAPLDAAALVAELEAAGYRSAGAADQPGRYARSGARFVIHTRAFTYADGRVPARRLTVTLANRRVASVRAGGEAVSLARVDPAEIATIRTLKSEDRRYVPLAKVPDLLVTGIQAVEDRRFKHHRGIDIRGLGRALWQNLRHLGVVEGGSTITQQLVKSLYLSPDRTLWRKLNEAVMAVALERRFDKRRLLEAYINEIYLGQTGSRAIHGFPRASEFYFGVPVESLQPHQVALLIGLARGPSWYNPWRHPERAKRRRDTVLDIFYRTSLLNATERERMQARPLDVLASPNPGSTRYPAFVDLVRRQLRRDYAPTTLRSRGLKILTTLDPVAQQAAERAVQQRLDAIDATGELQAGLVLVDPGSGEVQALVGDRQVRRKGFNRALDAQRQVGSVVKPFIYLLALNRPGRFSLVTPLVDRPFQVPLDDGGRWTPQNYSGESHGDVPLLLALARSYNQASARLGLDLGAGEVADLLRRLGVEKDVPAHPSLLLGAVELSPWQVAQAYQGLAADGYRTRLRAVRAVVGNDGEPRSSYPLRLSPLAERRAIPLLKYALSRVPHEGTARGLYGQLGRRLAVAAKTGTTDDRRDSWFVGFTDDRLGVVWVGRDDNKPAGISGSTAAMPVWAGLFADLPTRPLEYESAKIEWYRVDWPKALLADDDCPNARALPFLPDSRPEEWSSCVGWLESRLRNR